MITGGFSVANDPSPQDRPLAPAGWLSRSGWSGKLFVVGGLIGLVAVFLPLVSVSMEMMGFMRANQTAMVVDDWRGKVSLVGYLAALVFAWLLYPPGRSPAKPLTWMATGVGAVVGLLGIWLLIDTVRSRGGADMMGMMSANSTPGVGAFVNLAAAAAVAIAAMIKGREERLF
jgi:hypothetical protein